MIVSTSPRYSAYSAMTLINRGCQRAVRTGAERLDRQLMDKVKNDAAAEKARKELELALEARKITTKIVGKQRKAPGKERKAPEES